MIRKPIISVITIIFILLACLTGAQAAWLSNSQLYFDPTSVEFGFYDRVILDDLATDNSHEWTAQTDPVTDADILPVLKPGYYPEGYSFSVADYYFDPNVDYKADLTNGDLTAYFYESGQYLIRVTRQSGNETIYTVFAETGLLELPGSEDKTGPSRKISGPSGDLILVATGDDTLDQAAENIEDEGKNVERSTGVQDTIDKIKAASQAAGKKLHVELVGHGAPGKISMDNKQVDDENLIGPDDADIEAFQRAIDDHVKHLSLFSCRSAEGAAGDNLLEILAASIGIASGWTVPISVEDGYFNVDYREHSKMALMPEETVNVPLQDIPPSTNLCQTEWQDINTGIVVNASEVIPGDPSSCSVFSEGGQVFAFPGTINVDMSAFDGLSGKTVFAEVDVFSESPDAEATIASFFKDSTERVNIPLAPNPDGSPKTHYLSATDVDRLAITFTMGGGVNGIRLSNAPVSQSLKFYQMDFHFDPVYEDTEWGAVDFTFTGRESPMYLNLAVNGQWQIQNLPVLSREGVGVTQTIRAYFDLMTARGAQVTSLEYDYAFTPEIMVEMPQGRFPAAVFDDHVRLLGGSDGGQMPELAQAKKLTGGRVTSERSHVHRNFPNQEAGDRECAPVAVSNSLKFLNETHNLGLNDTQTGIDAMKDAVDFSEGFGAPLGTWWEKKDTYMKENDYPITTRKITDISKLAEEIDDGQDVELQESWIGKDGNKTGHTTALVGISKLENGKYALDIADDRKQGENGGTGITTYIYDPDTGKIDDSGFISDFEYAVVECPAEPVDYNLDGVVDMADAIGILQAVAQGESSPFGGQFRRGDVNRNNELDLGDLIEVLKILVGA